MADSELSSVPECELEAALLALRDNGAERFDPVRFRVIAAMADKAATHRPQTARLVRQRALARLIAYQENFQREQQKAQPLAEQIEKQHPEHGAQARQLFTSHHFAQLQQLASKLQRATTDEIHALAVHKGMQTMRNDGWLKICLGVSTFEEITRQTNLLALNAAVDAEEVRNLAGWSAQAVKETTELIEALLKKRAAALKLPT